MKTSKAALFGATLLLVVGCGDGERQAPVVDLHTAAAIGDIQAVQYHIDAGTDLNTREPGRGSTPLITATAFGRTAVAVALIEAGADVNIRNDEGSTALMTAAFFCHTEVVEALLDNGADKNIRNGAGRTALESVSLPFEEVKPIYDGLGAALGPVGLELDYERIVSTRPRIAEILR
jgi:hypothetical protein